MGMQVYVIAQRGDYTPETSRELQHVVTKSGGFILMVTRNGPIIAIDDGRASSIARHHLVEFMGPVTLNPRGVAAETLKQIFAENLSKQLGSEVGGDAESHS